jgi:hypothetical protein
MTPRSQKTHSPISSSVSSRGRSRRRRGGGSVVEFGPHEGYALVDAYFGLLDDLRALFGTEVDLLMAGAVRNRYVAREIERTKQLLYAA